MNSIRYLALLLLTSSLTGEPPDRTSGDFGLGTFDSLDGEMVALDGRFYQIRSNGIVSRVDVDKDAIDATTPFAAITRFEPDLRAGVFQATAIAQQSIFPLHDIRGTLVGFRSPAFEKGINQTGYHFHFISDDERSGGHVLDFQLSQATVEIEILREHSTFVPDNPSFRAAPLPLP